MARLNAALLGLALAWSSPAAADPLDRWSAHVEEASRRFGVPVAWIRRVMRAESAGRTTLNGRPIVSHAGAMGLMQLMPGTWADLRSSLGLGADPHEPRENILAGTAYLRMMYDRFGYPGLFAAYNAGPARYAEHLSRGRPLPAETVAYVAAVAGAEPTPLAPRRSNPAMPASATPERRPSLFVVRAEVRTALAAPPEAQAEAPSLFFALRGAAPR